MCPACGGAQPDADPRRIWCSDPCRAWVSDVGGPETAATVLEGWADDWAAMASIAGQEAKDTAADLRERAARLRELGDE